MIGFTGSREGMNEQQKKLLELALASGLAAWEDEAGDPPSFHHGDCVGADAQAHEIATQVGYFITVHPPDNPRHRAFCQGELILDAKPYHARNQDIVNATFWLIACPAGMEEVQRSGTWSTVRFARHVKSGYLHRKILIIYPDGSTVWDNL